MITLRRATARHHVQSRGQETWSTFHAKARADPPADGFGVLVTLDEDILPPGTGVPFTLRDDVEIVTYVLEGGLAQDDSTGCSGVLRAGEFQKMSLGRGIRHRAMNASHTDWAHIFQIGVRAAEADIEPRHEQKRFSVAERRGLLCVVVSPDGRKGSLAIHQDALIHSAILDVGLHLVHELRLGRWAWLHVVRGEVTLGPIVLGTGDGAGVADERAVSVTARERTEILLVDVCSVLGP
jgi:redox-sensitive bicupin YhaK (pirin superfamily)